MLRVLAAQFEDENSIAVRFRAGVEEVDLPSRVCGEVMRITQEALANVRKHSMANEVDICFQENHHGYALEIRDNGKGFEFSGRLSLEQLDADSKGPEIIKERVRLIAGSLIVESTPGQGSRLEVIIPRGQNGGT